MTTLSPLDLLFMSDIEQRIIRCLNEYPKITGDELAKIIKISEQEVVRILNQLIEQEKVVLCRKKGKKTYAVNYRSLTDSRIRNLPQNIWSIFE